MKNHVVRTGLKNIVYTSVAQLVSMILSFVSSFVLPFILGVTEFGYWQVYLFYAGYMLLFLIGFNDGLYLKYGQYDYESLPYKNLRSSIRVFLLVQILIVIILMFLIMLVPDINKRFALSVNVLFLPITVAGAISMTIVQFTNRMKLYSFLIVFGKVVLLVTILLLIFIKLDNYRLIIIADQIVKILVSLIAIYYCKDLFLGSGTNFIDGCRVLWDNIKTGISLMLAVVIGTLLVGIGRFIVERFMTVEDFSIYSFAFSSTNLALVFVTSIGISIYPMLKRLNVENLPIYFGQMNTILNIIVFASMFIYFPIYFIVQSFIPQYEEALVFLFILFPLVVSQAKMQIIINTYFKVLREERAMLRVNVLSIILFLVITIPIFYFWQSNTAIAITTLITSVWCCYVSEIYLKRRMNIKYYINILEEMIVILAFLVLCGFFVNIINALIGYGIIFTVYIIRHRKEIFSYFVKVKYLKSNLGEEI